jgi:hypothetical protein
MQKRWAEEHRSIVVSVGNVTKLEEKVMVMVMATWLSLAMAMATQSSDDKWHCESDEMAFGGCWRNRLQELLQWDTGTGVWWETEKFCCWLRSKMSLKHGTT